MTAVSVHQVADFFLRRAGEWGYRVSHLKLQKLCWFAQGFYLGMRREPLFREQLRAWPDGPVVRELADRYGGKSVWLEHCPLPDPAFEDGAFRDFKAMFTDDQIKFLSIVLARFVEYPAMELKRFAMHDEPYLEARRRLKLRRLDAALAGAGQCDDEDWDVIPHHAMIAYFKEHIADLSNAEAPAPPSAELVRKAREKAAAGWRQE